MELTAAGERQMAVTRNISLGGMFVEIMKPVAVGSAVLVRFKVPTQPEAIEVAGEVRWVESDVGGGVAGMGVRFQGLRAREVWALNRFFQS